MSKKANMSIVGVDGEQVTNSSPKISAVRPVGTQVLVEVLTAQEAMGTNMSIPGDSTSTSGAPQGYVVDVGPKVSDEWGFKVGDRITLHGNFTPLPEGHDFKNNSHRMWILVEPHQIKAVLVEDE